MRRLSECAEIWHGMAASGGFEEDGWDGGILDVIFKEKSACANAT